MLCVGMGGGEWGPGVCVGVTPYKVRRRGPNSPLFQFGMHMNSSTFSEVGIWIIPILIVDLYP